jgi:metal-dependent hydrolase (beta-lactamase superfamily II)
VSPLIRRGKKLGPDDFRGEQALFFNVKGKGLVILSGCANAGIINTLTHEQEGVGTHKIHAMAKHKKGSSGISFPHEQRKPFDAAL